MGPCKGGSATNSDVHVPVVSPPTANTANITNALTLWKTSRKRLLDDTDQEDIRTQKNLRESLIDEDHDEQYKDVENKLDIEYESMADYTTENEIDKEEDSSVESKWSIIPKPKPTTENKIDKEEDSSVESNWAFIPKPKPDYIGMIPELFLDKRDYKSDLYTLSERRMIKRQRQSDLDSLYDRQLMEVKEQKFIDKSRRDSNNRKNSQQGYEWWDPRYKGFNYLINCVASKTKYNEKKKK